MIQNDILAGLWLATCLITFVFFLLWLHEYGNRKKQDWAAAMASADRADRHARLRQADFDLQEYRRLKMLDEDAAFGDKAGKGPGGREVFFGKGDPSASEGGEAK